MTISKRSTSKSNREPHRKNKLEWAVFAISLFLLAGLLFYLVYQSVTLKKTTPDIKVSYLKDPREYNRNRYRILLENTGGETAEDIWVEASIVRGGHSIESSYLQIAFSPKRSKREGWVNFSLKPLTTDSIVVKVVSYKKM